MFHVLRAFVHHDYKLLKLIAPAGPAYLFFFLLAVYIWMGIPYRMQFRKRGSFRHSVEVQVTDTALLNRTPVGENEFKWNAFVAWGESKTTFLVYTEPTVFLIIPKHAMQPHEIPVFRELLRTQIRQPSVRLSV